MAHHTTKEILMDELRTNGVEFPPSATIRQLRRLYSACMNQAAPDSDADSEDLRGFKSPSNADAVGATAIAAFADIAVAVTAPNVAVDSNHSVNADNAAAVAVDANHRKTSHFDNADTAATVADTAVTAVDAVYESIDAENMNALDQQLLALKKRREITQLQQEIQELESKAGKGECRVHFTEIEHAVTKFSGNNPAQSIRDFFKDFEEIMKAVNGDEKFKLLSLRRSLDGTARLFLSTTSALKYAELKIALINEFDVTISRNDIYRMLSNRKWNSNESLHSYILIMQSLAKQGNVEETEIIDFILDGIRNKISNINLLMTAQTLAELKRLVSRYYDKYLKPSTLSTARRTAAAVSSKPPTAERQNNENTEHKVRRDPPLCFNCSERGHIKKNCPHPLRPNGSCFRCWNMGHDHYSCPNPKKVLKSTGQPIAAVYEDCIDMEALNMSD